MMIHIRQRGLQNGCALVMTIGLLLFVTSVQAEEKRKHLYERLGGYDAISAVVSDFADHVFADKKLAPFFGGWPPEKQARFKQLNVLLVCKATGGPSTYIGRTMPVTHQGMGVTDMNFDQVAGHLSDTLDKFKVPKAEKAELLGVVGGLRGDIVGK